MRVAVSGASGLVGSALLRHLADRDVELVRIVRDRGGGGIFFSPDEGAIDAEALRGVGAVVHLAGESVGAGRWTPEQKARIRDSRVRGTGLLASALAGMDERPDVLVCASAVGYYGDGGDEELDEESPPGQGFLAEVSQAWEAACAPARDGGVRVVSLRIGLVLSGDGGALPKMMGPFRLGLGGRIGDGRQWVSFIAIDDLVRIIERAIDDRSLRGAVNAVAPSPVRNAELTRALGAVLRRPAVLPVPAAAVRLGLGREMADALLLSSQRVIPRRLREAGFEWRFPELEPALRHVLAS
jgi:hypothetical protein